MADELNISFQGSGTLYAIIRRKSDYYAWNGSTFETWADGNIATYDIPLTSRGGDHYSADFPTGIDAGTYTILYYEQDGGAPATTDLLLDSYDRAWTGDALVSDASVTLSAYALTTLALFESFESVTTDIDDTLATHIINAVSAEIEHVCGINFKAREYVERHNGVRQRRLKLKHCPIVTIDRICYGSANAMSLTYTSGTAIRANATVTDTGIQLVSIASNGTRTANHLQFSDYASLSAMETAIEAISGWTATVQQNIPSNELNRTGSEDALNRSVQFYYPDRDDVEYDADYANGIVEFHRMGNLDWRPHHTRDYGYNGFIPDGTFPRHFQGVLVKYRAGYESIPADVQWLATEMAVEKYYGTFDNPSVKSRTVGPVAVTFGSDDYMKIRQRLANHIDAAGYIGGV